jgi:hypothetical protein
MGRLRVVSGLVRAGVRFMRVDRSGGRAPSCVAWLGLGAFIVFTQGSALAPFIYALF